MIDKAVILSAGQGSRLLPLTAERPKCLLDFSGRSLIAWQVDILASAGVREIDVVTGFMTELVEQELDRLARPGLALNAVFNPFFKVADNLGSCWIAREKMDRDFVLLNGDTLISPQIASKVLAGSDWPITVTIDVKDRYDSDDMKVSRIGDRLVAIDKTLTPDQSNAESIGFLAFRGEGVALFREAVRAHMRTPAGVENWYLKIVDGLAPGGKTGTLSIEGLDWAEVDYLTDIEIAMGITERWSAV